MKKILVTGLTGFIGSWLSILLNDKKYKVYGISLLKKNPLNVYNKCKIEKFANSYICDILNYEELKKIFIKIKPDFVVHLAAQPIVLESYKRPLETIFTNIIGALNVMKLTSIYGSGQMINFTSDKVYQNEGKNIFFKEIDTLKGNDPYSLSKSCSDLVGQNLNQHLKNLKVSTIRCGNIIGGGDWSNHRLIADYYGAYLKNKNLIIRNSNYIRPWQHVITPISIIYQIIKKNNIKFFDTFNIGPNKSEVKVKDIILQLNKINYKNPVKIKFTDNKKPKETKSLKLNTSKSKKIFNYPKKNLNYDILILNKWYIKSFITKNMHEFTLNQINQYLK